jgi:cellulose synthase/poly-beta-1,6-N-acetylglucosamine synthase-like glycosyltransferase
LLGAEWFREVRKVPVLRDVEESVPTVYPSLSVVVPARDEERAVGKSVRSMVAQEYPGTLEVVAVDDRSADRTGEILGSLLVEHPSLLRALHVTRLTEGWLGKNYALSLERLS